MTATSGPAGGRAAVAVLLWAAALGGCEMARPTIALHDVRATGMDFEKVELVYEFHIHNPNTYRVGLWAFDVSLVAGGEEFARVELPRPAGGVSTGQTEVVSVPLTLRFADVPVVVARADQPSGCALSVEATFSYLTARRGQTFAHAGWLPPLRQPSWHFRALRLAGREEGVVELVFDVENPNTFALPIRRLTGVVRSDREALVQVDRPAPGPVPPTRTARLVVPVSLGPEAAVRAAARAEAAPGSVRFEGRLHLDPPPSLAAMLMGERTPP
jgi:LEA14-like dessication related protein